MMIYLDNAATSFPRPEAVCAEMNRVNRTLSVNAGRGGYKAVREASKIIYDTKKKLAELFHCDGKADVVFTPSVTQAFNQVFFQCFYQTVSFKNTWDLFKNQFSWIGFSSQGFAEQLQLPHILSWIILYLECGGCLW